jgi:hypothetical protein
MSELDLDPDRELDESELGDLGEEPVEIESVDGLDRSDIEELIGRDDVESRDQAVGTLLDEFSEEEIEEIPSSELLKTSGLTSYVRDSDGETLGHIYLTEWDRVDNPMIPVSSCVRKPGISVLVRSSATNYHHYNLSVRPFEEQIRDLAADSGDLGHVRWSARRGYSVLRILPKLRIETEEEYRPAPELIRVFDSPSDYPQSRKHLELLRSIAEDQGSTEIVEDLDTAREKHELIGSTLPIDHYQTITDEAKEVIR